MKKFGPNIAYLVADNLHIMLLGRQSMKLPNNATFDSLRGTFAGQKCVLAGGAPSLNLVEGVIEQAASRTVHVAVNYSEDLVPKIFPKLDINIIADPGVAKIYGSKLLCGELNFVRTDALHALVCEGQQINNCFGYQYFNEPTMDKGYFTNDPQLGVHRGYTVILDALQILKFLGFSKIAVIGVDLDYSGKYHYAETDDRHKQLPNKIKENFALVSRCFAVARLAFEATSTEVFNCSPTGKLESFERVTLKQFMELA